MKLTRKDIARITYNANATYSKCIGDDSKPLWEDATQFTVDSIIHGIQSRINNNDLTPEEIHINWLDFKARTGWVYGKDTDHDKKTHPCIMSYKNLPEEQKAKDKLFSGIVDALKHLL